MNKKVKGIVLIVIGLAVVGALHQFVFAPLKTDYARYNQELDRLRGQYRTIVSEIPKEGSQMGGGGLMPTENQIATGTERVLRVINEKNDIDQKNFSDLDQKLKIIEHFDSNREYQNDILSEIDRMQQLERNSPITKLSVTGSWGVNMGIVEGRFGSGFYAEGRKTISYYNLATTRVINPRRGTVEFYMKPDWDPMDVEAKHKCIFLALSKQKMTKEQLEKLADGVTDDRGQPLNINMIVGMGTGPFPRESMVAIYKGEGPTLIFELKDYVRPASRVTAYIQDWKPGQWYHIAAVWESKQQALYINGRNRGIPFSGGISIRNAQDTEEMDLLGDAMLSAYGFGGGMGMIDRKSVV
jgi:hypothetical protein